MGGMDAKDRKIEQLERVIAEQAAMIDRLVERVDELERQLAKARKRWGAEINFAVLLPSSPGEMQSHLGGLNPRRERVERGRHWIRSAVARRGSPGGWIRRRTARAALVSEANASARPGRLV